MLVPNKQGRKSRAETTLLPALSLSLLIFFFFSVLFCSVLPVHAGSDEEKLSLILIDGEEIYVRSGNYYTFLQGYQIYIKGADTEGSRVWIELRRNDVFLEDTIVREGDTFVYSNNSSEILNLKVDTIYAGADGVLVRFSPVYQYLDPKLPMPQKPDTSPANNSDNNSSTPTEFENQAEGFDMPIFLLSIGAVLLGTGFFAGIYKKKFNKK
ncbi:hypothetical protein MSLAZ_0436 [Methanosarcina lacustris Z-7289]|uniref:S-layer family duplication domain-containing protein n=1 Tax=Methanosarcina lacustris Z-7289 TaxID=1434111 RepID=A0A0E3S3N0_9EURY|nr:S-layer protein domain-containing protein [Methanosarcina lacustris]AKB73697.1 hypothetical protein MSLAZ_0436 [Methanosarcina lacustris Z-7289]